MEEKELLKSILLQMLNNVSVVTAARLGDKITYHGINDELTEAEMITSVIKTMREIGGMDLQGVLEYVVSFRNMLNSIYIEDEVNCNVTLIMDNIIRDISLMTHARELA